MRFIIPIAILAVLIVLFAVGMQRDPRLVPSPLIGKVAPAFDLATIPATETLISPTDFKGRPVVINFFASWCAGCQIEHPVLQQLANQGVEIIGVDYKDTDAAISAWLAERGNPYKQVLADPLGATGLDWGVYGVPETYLLAADGTIAYKHVGPMTMEVWKAQFAPLMNKGKS